MDFFTDLMGLILLIVCILIVLIFLKDYIRLGGKKTTVNKKQKMIVYEVHQNNKRIQQGWITDDQLPFQFGRNAGSGNDGSEAVYTGVQGELPGFLRGAVGGIDVALIGDLQGIQSVHSLAQDGQVAVTAHDDTNFFHA